MCKKFLYTITISTIMLLSLTNVYASVDLYTLAMTESRNDTKAVSCAGARHGRGAFQISEVALEDYNNYHTHKYTTEDLFNYEIAKHIASWLCVVRIPDLLRAFGYGDSSETETEAILHVYNVGIGDYHKGVRNDKYVKRYMSLL